MAGQAGRRDGSIDALRGVAVALMVAAHASDFINAGNGVSVELRAVGGALAGLGAPPAPPGGLWNALRDAGNALCYTIFLFTFGLGAYLSLLAKPGRAAIRPALARAGRLYLAYALMAGWAIWLRDGFGEPLAYLAMLAFVEVPSYVEFMVSFVAAMLGLIGLKLLAPDAPPAWPARLPTVLAAGAALFFAGASLYILTGTSNMGQPGAAYLGLLSGKLGAIRFPLLQYAPALLLGLWAGAALVASQAAGARRADRLGLLSLGLLALYGLLKLGGLSASTMLGDELQRWPPSLVYAARGLFWTASLFWLLRLPAAARLIPPLAALGRQALPVLIFHICALRLAQHLAVGQTDNPLAVLAWYLGLLLGGAALGWATGAAKRRLGPRRSPRPGESDAPGAAT